MSHFQCLSFFHTEMTAKERSILTSEAERRKSGCKNTGKEAERKKGREPGEREPAVVVLPAPLCSNREKVIEVGFNVPESIWKPDRHFHSYEQTYKRLERGDLGKAHVTIPGSVVRRWLNPTVIPW